MTITFTQILLAISSMLAVYSYAKTRNFLAIHGCLVVFILGLGLVKGNIHLNMTSVFVVWDGVEYHAGLLGLYFRKMGIVETLRFDIAGYFAESVPVWVRFAQCILGFGLMLFAVQSLKNVFFSPNIGFSILKAKATLGLAPWAGKEAIKKAYRRQAKKYHPDSAMSADTRRFIKIDAAYKWLRLNGF